MEFVTSTDLELFAYKQTKVREGLSSLFVHNPENCSPSFCGGVELLSFGSEDFLTVSLTSLFWRCTHLSFDESVTRVSVIISVHGSSCMLRDCKSIFIDFT